MDNNELQPIEPRPCEVMHCQSIAHWQYNGVAVCAEDMQVMSNMNGDNEQVFKTALAYVEEEK